MERGTPTPDGVPLPPAASPERAEEGTTMSTIWRLTAFLSIAALALFAAVSAGAGTANATYTCTKTKHNGDTEVRVLCRHTRGPPELCLAIR